MIYTGRNTLLEYIHSGIADGMHSITMPNGSNHNIECIHFTSATTYENSSNSLISNDTNRFLVIYIWGNMTINPVDTLQLPFNKRGVFIFVAGELFVNGKIDVSTSTGTTTELPLLNTQSGLHSIPNGTRTPLIISANKITNNGEIKSHSYIRYISKEDVEGAGNTIFETGSDLVRINTDALLSSKGDIVFSKTNIESNDNSGISVMGEVGTVRVGLSGVPKNTTPTTNGFIHSYNIPVNTSNIIHKPE